MFILISLPKKGSSHFSRLTQPRTKQQTTTVSFCSSSSSSPSPSPYFTLLKMVLLRMLLTRRRGRRRTDDRSSREPGVKVGWLGWTGRCCSIFLSTSTDAAVDYDYIRSSSLFTSCSCHHLLALLLARYLSSTSSSCDSAASELCELIHFLPGPETSTCFCCYIAFKNQKDSTARGNE